MIKFLLGLGVGVAGTLGVLYVRNRILAAKAVPLMPSQNQPFEPITGGMINRTAQDPAITN